MGRIYPFNEIFLVAHNPKAEHLNINKLLEEGSSCCATRHHMATVGDGGAGALCSVGAPLVWAAIYLYLLTLDYDHQSSRSLEETRLCLTRFTTTTTQLKQQQHQQHWGWWWVYAAGKAYKYVDGYLLHPNAPTHSLSRPGR